MGETLQQERKMSPFSRDLPFNGCTPKPKPSIKYINISLILKKICLPMEVE